MKKIITLSITAFWIVMSFFLVKKEFITPKAVVVDHTSSSTITLPEGVTENWMGIYLNDVKIGYTNTFIQNLNKRGLKGYTIRNTTDLRIPILGENRHVYMEGLAYLTEDKQIKDFLFFFTSGKHKIELKGNSREGVLVVNIKGAEGIVSDQTITLDRDAVLINFIGSPLIMEDLKVGKVIKTKVFDPMTLNPGYAKTKIISAERLKYLDQNIKVFVVEHEFKGITTKSWIGEDGTVYREETASGFVMKKEYREKALVMGNPFDKKADILDQFSVSSSVSIKDPRNTEYLKAKLSGLNVSEFDVESERQVLTDKFRKIFEISISDEDDIASIRLGANISEPLDEYLRSELLIQADNPVIRDKALEIIGSETDAWKAVKLLNNWVYQNINKVPVISIPSAIDVLTTREGDCNEHTALFTALSRSVGIPTKICAGVVYTKGRFYYHAWPAVYLNKWVYIDPTFGQKIADATHIELVEGNLDKQLEIIKILGKIDVEVIEYR